MTTSATRVKRPFPASLADIFANRPCTIHSPFVKPFSEIILFSSGTHDMHAVVQVERERERYSMNLVLQVPRAFLPPERRVEGATLPVQASPFSSYLSCRCTTNSNDERSQAVFPKATF